MNGDSTGGTPGLESRLRRALAGRAETAAVRHADWGDLAGRIARTTRRRQRFLAAASGLALVIGAAGGYFGEAAAAGNGVGSLAAGTTTVPGPRSASGAQRPNSSTSGPTSSGVPCRGLPSGSNSAGVGTSTHVFSRTTADGVTIRVYRLPSMGLGCASTVVPGCVGATSIELSDDTAVAVGSLGSAVGLEAPTPAQSGQAQSVQPQTETTTPPSSSSAGVQATSEPQAISDEAFGVVEGDPVWWIAVQVGAEVASAKATFADGSVDQMAPTGGIAVLAHHVSNTVASTDPGPYTVRATLELLGPNGEVVATMTLPLPQPVPVPLPGPAPLPPAPAAGNGSTGTGSASPGSTSGPARSVAPVTTTSTASTVAPPTGGGSSPPGGAVACPQLGAPTPG